MLQTKVKANSITNLTDARYFAAWEVNWLGFCLDQNASEYVSPQQVHAFKDWVDGPKIVGEFGMQSAEDILALAEDLKLDAIQLGAFTDAETRIALKEYQLIQEVIVEKDMSFSELENQLDALQGQVALFLLNMEANGITTFDLERGIPFSGEELGDLCERYPILLGLQWAPKDVPGLLETHSPEGIFVKGGEEEKVGFKSFDELDELFELLEVFE